MNEFFQLQVPPVMAELDDILFFVVIAVFGLIKFIGSKMSKADGAEDEDDPEKARRRREIQEEIRRRLAERMAQDVPPGTVVTIPEPRQQPVQTVFERHAEPQQRPLAAGFDRSASTDDAARRHAEERSSRDAMRKRNNLMEQLEAARREEVESRERARVLLQGRRTALLSEQAFEAANPALSMEMLNRPGALRDAIVLSEVLGAPVSERKSGSCLGWGE